MAEIILETNTNKFMVETLYAAISVGDSATAIHLLAPDLEWWFHGPPGHDHMMRTLTGNVTCDEFPFVPRHVVAIGEALVVVEGWEGEDVYWVHVWTVEGGVITKFREYFNTSLTVRKLAPRTRVRRSARSALWESHFASHGCVGRRSLPGLILAL